MFVRGSASGFARSLGRRHGAGWRPARGRGPPAAGGRESGELAAALRGPALGPAWAALGAGRWAPGAAGRGLLPPCLGATSHSRRRFVPLKVFTEISPRVQKGTESSQRGTEVLRDARRIGAECHEAMVKYGAAWKTPASAGVLGSGLMAEPRGLMVIGGGKMGEALVAGLIRTGWAPPEAIVVVEQDQARRDELARSARRPGGRRHCPGRLPTDVARRRRRRGKARRRRSGLPGFGEGRDPSGPLDRGGCHHRLPRKLAGPGRRRRGRESHAQHARPCGRRGGRHIPGIEGRTRRRVMGPRHPGSRRRCRRAT